ncbi:MAG: DUF6702 family protein [Bacteroidota bacterium]
MGIFNIIAIYLLTLVPVHEFHLSKTLVEYNPTDQALQISMHIYLDDLEAALRLKGADELYLCTEKEVPEAEAMLETYLRKKFKISLNEQEANYNFLGKEISEDLLAAWCYIEIPNVTEVTSLGVTNAILLDLYDDQKNIIHIIGPERREGYFMFQKGEVSDSVAF